MARVISFVLAGCEGGSLGPLILERAKPAVPFAGSYRLIDFALNNLANSDLLKVYILTQFKSQSLSDHLRKAWRFFGIADYFIDTVPAQMLCGRNWYVGTADAIFQNSSFIPLHEPDYVCVFGSDQVFKMDVRQFVNFHERQPGGLTIAATWKPVEEAHKYGVICCDEQGRVTEFHEKPGPELAGRCAVNGKVRVSTGNYVFNTELLMRAVADDARQLSSSHDFGRDIIPKLILKETVQLFDLGRDRIPGENYDGYWMDVDSLDDYWQAHMTLLENGPAFQLDNPKWPFNTYYPPLPPALISDVPGQPAAVTQSMVSAGCVIRGASIDKSVLGFSCRLAPGSTISQSLLLGDVEVGAGSWIRRAIIDKEVTIAPGTVIGENEEQDLKRFHLSAEGIVVIPKGAKVGF